MALRDICYNHSSFSLSYEILEANTQNNDKSVLFLHGWGANKEIMKNAFKNPFKDFRQIYLDLPGFGKSSIPQIPLKTSDYAKIIKSFLESIQHTPQLIVGHSFGGKIAVLLQPSKIALLSSAGIIPKKSLKVKTKITLAKLLKNIPILSKVGVLLRSRDAEGMGWCMYETFKNVVGEDFSEHFRNFLGRAWIFWGREDKTTPLSSGERIAELIPNNKLYVLEGDHFFFTQQENAKAIAKCFLEID